MNKITASDIESQIKKSLVFKAKDLEALVGKRSLIPHLLKCKMVESLGSGFYASPKLSRFESVVLISQRYFPKAVLSGATALKLHGLMDREIEQIDADIPKETSQRSHLLSFSRVANSRFSGIETIDFMGARVRVYNPERALVDCLLKKADPKIFSEALRKYIARGKISSDRISELDREFGTDLRERIDAVLLKTVYAPKAKGHSEKSPKDPLAESERLLQAAILVYARVGAAGLDFRLVSDEAGVSLNAVTSYFRTKTELREAVLSAVRARIVKTGAKSLSSERYNREWLEQNVEAYLSMSEMDEIGHRIQRWCMAEQNLLVASITDLCSELIRGVAQVVMNEVEGVDVKTAESRALLLVSLLDQFASVRWFYASLLDTHSSKKELIENYKKTLRSQMESLLFSPLQA